MDQLFRRESNDIEIIPSNPNESCLEHREIHSGPTGTPIFRLRYTDVNGEKRFDRLMLTRN